MEKNSKKDRKILMREHGIPNTFEFANLLDGSSVWSFEKFKKGFSVKIVRETPDKFELEFDLIGCNAALANAFRRILLSEVPTIAIEKVYMFNNTSIIQDEVLSHRLGLIPLKAHPKLLEWPAGEWKQDEVDQQSTLSFELKVTCKRNPQAPKDARRPSDIYLHHNVYSSDIKWVPLGEQHLLHPDGAKKFGPIHDDILIAKMRPGHEIHAQLYAVKGIGKDHAKFSPVATAAYRLLPDIEIVKEVTGEAAERLQSCFSPGVIDVKVSQGIKKAVVKDARYESCSRNFFRHDDLKDCIKLSRVADHFIFTVESVGALPSSTIFIEAVEVLKEKCKTFLSELEEIA
ncbi:DNA-directed RNA polymerases I and III subunit RPAC1 [Trichogramma pretiosum]|uniref:DNA-directed RNA polymerases I and III subunit RPAC1 n=1 Tax=Trichogramma pretiosum TaxID=7493 RepID=UPI0006C95D2C|nr:DNA-directed RNA polymerases I and III subunit RPAC1 [Trichogramma pretiosum]